MNILDNNDKFIEFREEYPVFTYEKYAIEEIEDFIKLSFVFKLTDNIAFMPSATIPKKSFNFKLNASDAKLRNIIFSIGLVELISYWKCACPPKVILKAGALTEEQKLWWKKLYFNGLGEFFYINSIETNINDFMEIENQSDEYLSKESFKVEEGNIIPIGGGKDSIVTLETLSRMKEKNTCLILDPRGASLDSAISGGYVINKIFEIHRVICPKLLELNKKDYLNGHTPFSALLGFMTVFAAALLGKKYITLSNESSANESNIEGSDVNHQYSKSFEFEKDFTDYISEYVTDDIKYFSILRPLSELQIAEIFSRYKKYHEIFRSCNAGSKQNIWCGKCSKCLFVFIMLSPFLSEAELTHIFGKNLFEDKELLTIFEQLVGVQKVKPFDCVGTRDEVNAALSMSLKKYDLKLPYLLKHYKENLGTFIKSDEDIEYYRVYFDEENLLLEKYKNFLKENM